VRNGNTFGGDAQWGKVGPTTLGVFASAIRPNPTADPRRILPSGKRPG
jgi:hypothetical protein